MTSIRIRRVAIALGAGALLLTGAGTVGYAVAATSTTTKTVSACANKYGRLALKSNTGHCPAGFGAVTLNKQGPRGATGKTGPRGYRGYRGFAGPGAQSIYFSATSADSQVRHIGKVDYTTSCTVDADGRAYSSLKVAPALGTSVRMAGTSRIAAETGGSFTDVNEYSEGSTVSIFIGAASGLRRHKYGEALHVTTSAGATQLVFVDILSDSRGGMSECGVDATVIPVS